jgi:putative NADPH-quinone reductase
MSDTPHPRVLGLLGSPRVKSNSGVLLARVLAGAEEAGAEVEQVSLRELQLQSCQHCRGCDRTGECVLADETRQLYTRLRLAQHVVLASPVHFSGVSGEMKMVIDRAQAMWVEKYRLRRRPSEAPEPRRGLFIATCGGPDARVFEWAGHSVKAFFNTAGFSYWGELFETRMDEPPPVGERRELLARAEKLGAELVGASG